VAAPRIPLSLRGKLAAAFLLVLLPVLGLLIYDYLVDIQEVQRIILEDELRESRVLGSMLDTTFEGGVTLGQALAIDPVVQTLDASVLDSYLARYRPTYRQYESVDVWDTGGRCVGTSVALPPNLPRPTISSDEFFQRVMATGEPVISSVIVAPTTGRPAIGVLVPVKDPAGQTLGAVSVFFDPGSLQRPLQGVGLRPGQTVWAAGPDGRLAFLSTAKELSWAERDAAGYQPIRSALQRGLFLGTVEQTLEGGGPRLVAVARTLEYGWVAGVSTPVQGAVASMQQGAGVKIGFFLGSLLLATLLALGLTRFVSRPLAELARTMAAFGRGERQRRALVATGDELETVASAFNSMAGILQREHERLHFLNGIGAALTSTLEVDRAVQLLAERSTEVLADGCLVYLLEGPERRECKLVGAHDRRRPRLERLKTLIDRHHPWIESNIVLPVTRSGEPYFLPHMAAANSGEGFLRELQEMGAASLMVVPLRARGHILGVLVAFTFDEQHPFDQEDLELASVVASRAAMAVDNAALLEQIRAERQRLQTVLDTIPVGVVVAEMPSARVTLVSSRGEAILGRPWKAAPIERWAQEYGFYRPNGELYSPSEDPLARSLLKGEVCINEEMVVRPPSGREIFVLANSAPLKGVEGQIIGAVGAFQDFTVLKETQRRLERANSRVQEVNRQLVEASLRERELAESAERRRAELNAVIEAVGEGILVADGSGRILQINGAGREILATEPSWAGVDFVAEYAGRFALQDPAGRPIPFEQWPLARALRGELFSGLEAVLRRRDGSESHLLFSSGILRDEQGRVRLAMTVFRDITPIRQLERAREEFISVIAHDLRSPLTVIIGFAGMLQRIPPDRHGQDEENRAVQSILTSAKRLEKMVADLLDASRIEARRLKLELQVVDLPRLLHEIMERTSEITKGHPLRLEIHDPIPPIEADPARLEQILVNLLSNAAKYSYPESEILIESRTRPGEIVLSVTNEGQGIPPEEQKVVFERFRRTQAAARGKVTGLGLGLYITKGLVEAHGGQIWVESEPGKTTTFYFTLPIGPRARGGSEE